MLASTHTTREGKEMLVAEMDNKHLRNTVRIFVMAAEKARAEFDAVVAYHAEKPGLTPAMVQAQRAIYGKLPVLTEQQAAERFAEITVKISEHLQRYIFEAWLRQPVDLNDDECLAEITANLAVRWSRAIGRSTPLPSPQFNMLSGSQRATPRWITGADSDSDYELTKDDDDNYDIPF